jgi:hypothetical protein
MTKTEKEELVQIEVDKIEAEKNKISKIVGFVALGFFILFIILLFLYFVLVNRYNNDYAYAKTIHITGIVLAVSLVVSFVLGVASFIINVGYGLKQENAS